MTPNPLIKNSFASPVKENPNNKTCEKEGGLGLYQESQGGNRAFATMSSSKKPRGRNGAASPHSNNATALIKAIPIQKIDISQFSNQMESVPKIKGIKRQLLLSLYVAKCKDLVINTSKQ